MTVLLDRASRLAAAHAKWLAPLTLVGLVGFTIWCAAIGVDFGVHWDEHYHVEGVRECVDGLVLAPRRYIYGSVYFLLGIVVLLGHNLGFLPAFFREMGQRQGYEILDVDHYASVGRFQEQARALLATPRYLLETRMVFFSLSALGALWIYLTIRKLQPGRHLGALAGAAFLALSWELHYHGRFVAVDALMAQLTALELYLIVCACAASSTGWFPGLYAGAAVVAGASVACKATGLALLAPVAVLPFVRPVQPGQARRAIRWAALAGVIAAVTLIVLQPGTLFDLFRYVSTLRRESWEYSLNHSVHSNSTADVLVRSRTFLAWLWLAVPSPYVVGAAVLSAVTLLGMVRFARERPRLSIAGGSLALLMLVTMAVHPLLIVRQFLLLIPFQAVAFGVGIATLQFRLSGRPLLRRAVLLAVALVFAFNARWLYTTARTIPNDTLEGTLGRLTADLLARPQPIRLSRLVYAAVAPRLSGYRCDAARPTAPDPDTPLAIRSDERIWHTNQLGVTRRTYGARWVNFDWYMPWVGRPESPPIFVLSAEDARRQHIRLEEYGRCEPDSRPGNPP